MKRGPKPKIRRTDIILSVVKIDANKHPGPQLLELRKMMNITGVNMAKELGMDSGNLYHFEKGTQMFAKYHNTTLVFAYARALGAKKVEYTL